jgi:hypothetical protein
MPTVTWSAEGGSNGTGITTGNSGGASGTAFDSVSLGAGASAVYDNAQAHNGTLAAKLATGGSAADCSLNWSGAIGTQTQVFYRAHLWMSANPASNHRLMDAFDSVSGQLCFAVYLTTTGKLMSVNTGGSTIQTTTNSVNLSAFSRIEVMVIGSATVGQVEIKLFNNPDSATATETLTSAASQNTRGSFNNYRFGAAGDPLPASRTLWLDDLGISTIGYLGPTASAVTLTPATATWAAVAGTPVPQPVIVALTPAAGIWSATPASPAPQPVTVALIPAPAGWSAVAVSPAPGPVTVSLAAADTTWSALPLTTVPQPVTLALTPAGATWTARPVTTPASRTTFRPFTGITLRPNTGVTTRP